LLLLDEAICMLRDSILPHPQHENIMRDAGSQLLIIFGRGVHPQPAAPPAWTSFFHWSQSRLGRPSFRQRDMAWRRGIGRLLSAGLSLDSQRGTGTSRLLTLAHTNNLYSMTASVDQRYFVQVMQNEVLDRRLRCRSQLPGRRLNHCMDMNLHVQDNRRPTRTA
jgi:hypothetical protein